MNKKLGKQTTEELSLQKKLTANGQSKPKGTIITIRF